MNKKAKKNQKETFSGQTIEKLKEQMLVSKKELFNLRFQTVLGAASDTSRFKKARKVVARLKTELTKRSNGVK